jgi:hypothetical protein
MGVVGIISLKFLIKQIYISMRTNDHFVYRWRFSLMFLANEEPVFSSKCAFTASYRYFLIAIANVWRISDKIIVNIVTIND